MKKLLLSISALGIASILAIGATTAYFSDSEVSSNNTFAAGTLDLNLNGGDSDVAVFNVQNMIPGHTQPHGLFKLKNVGTMPGKVKITSFTLRDYENGVTDPEATAGDTTTGTLEGELSQRLNVRIWIDTDHNGWISTGEVVLYNGKISNLPTSGLDLNKTLAANEEIDLKFLVDWWVSPDDNLAQGDSLEMDIEFTLSQN
jgi:spore coat-associated protein N